jgi:ubiquinone/menaquinone biosynthesis C-methylase UbiE
VTTRGAVRSEYAEAAARYDERWAEYLEETTHRTLDAVDLAPGERLLDVGSGTGLLLRAAAREFPDSVVIGADLSIDMLRSARSTGFEPPLVAADAVALPVADASCAVVVTASSLHFWPEPDAGLREILRVLRPGGMLVLTDWCDDYWSCRVIDRWLRWTGRATYHHVYGSSECERLLTGAGFHVTRVERYRVGLIWGLMTLTALAGGPGGTQR